MIHRWPAKPTGRSSSGAPEPLTCHVCAAPLKSFRDSEPVRERGVTVAARCADYAGCMVRAARKRREEIGAEGASADTP